MLLAFIGAVAFTIGASFYCSLMESLILSTTVAEIEGLKKSRPRKGAKLEHLKIDLPNTISAILTLNTIANTAGTALVGGLAVIMWGNAVIGIITGTMTLGVLIFSEIIPKNLGVVYRTQLHPWIVDSLVILRILMTPITYMTNASIKLVVKGDIETDPDADEKEIILLAEKGAKEGSLTSDESDMVTNALNHSTSTTVSNCESFRCSATDKRHAARCSIKTNITDDDVVRCLEGGFLRRVNNDLTTRQSFTHIIVGITFKLDGDSTGKESSKALTS